MRLSILFFFVTINLFGQINIEDSTVQAITYWEKGETYNYFLKNKKIKIDDGDTTVTEDNSYKVKVSIKEATEDSYTVEWFYSDFKSEITNETMEKLSKITDKMKVIFKTNEMGVFQEVVNWKEIKSYTDKAIETLTKDFKDVPQLQELIKQISSLFSTKESIENTAIRDIQQYHTFFGASYKLGQIVEAQMQGPNVFGGEPFDIELAVYLEEYYPNDDLYDLVAIQEVDKEQLTNATIEYVTKLTTSMGVEAPDFSNFPELSNDIVTFSRFHNTGWLTYSSQTTTVVANEYTSIETREIELVE